MSINTIISEGITTERGTSYGFLMVADKSLAALEGRIELPASVTNPNDEDSRISRICAQARVKTLIAQSVAFDILDAEDEVKGADEEDVQAADFIPLVIKRSNPNPRRIATLADEVFDRWQFSLKLTEDDRAELLEELD